MVISPKPFNLLTKTPLTVPITTGGNFAKVAGFTVKLKGSKTTGVIRCDQPRATDIRARNGKKIETLNQNLVDEVLAIIQTIIL